MRVTLGCWTMLFTSNRLLRNPTLPWCILSLLWVYSLLAVVGHLDGRGVVVEAQPLPGGVEIGYVAELPAGACGGRVRELNGNHAKYVLNGTVIEVIPYKRDKTLETRNKFAFVVSELREMLSYHPHGNGACTDENTVVQSFKIADCQCIDSELTEEGDGWRDVGVQFIITNCSGHDNMTFTLRMVIPQQYHEEVYTDLLPGSILPNFTYIHPVGALKLGFTLIDWNWSSEYMSNQSFFAINYQLLSFCRDGGHAVPRLKAESLGLELDVGGLPFLINLERGIIFEGRPSIAAYTYPLYNISLPKAEEAWLYFSLTQGFCSPSIYPFQKWQNITYDPTIMSLLTDEGTPATEDTPLQAKKSKTALIVSLSVIIPVVVIVTVIAILANTVPKVKYFFRPYTKRRPTAASVELRSSTPNTTSATNGKGWHNAAKPT